MTYKAILCDPVTATVTEVQMKDGLQPIYDVLRCTTITGAYPFGSEDSIFCDDDGLYNWSHFVVFKGAPQPYAGPCLIIGCDDEGETITPKMTLEEAKAITRFAVNTSRGLLPINEELAPIFAPQEGA